MAKKIKLNDKDNDWSGSNKPEIVFGNGGDDALSGGGGNDKLNGNEGNDILRGGRDDDKLNGGLGDDTMLGGSGDDTLVATSGNDTVDGGTGDDLVKIAGNFADAVIVMDGDYYSITINGVTTKVKNTELFQFADGTKTVDEVDDVANPDPVEPTNLTVGQDTFTGTAGADLFSAAAINPVSGLPATTLQAFDSVDGGDGDDTLDIFVSGAAGGPYNNVQQGTIKNVETINLYADGGVTFGTGATFDASKFVGATTINQVGGTNASIVTNLGADQTAGFKDQANAFVMQVAAAATAGSVNVALTNVVEGSALVVTSAGDALNSLTVKGNLVDGLDADTLVNVPLTTVATLGKDQQTFTLNSEVATALFLAEGAGSTKMITTVDASGSKGGVTFTGDADVATLKGGSGDDTLVMTTLTSATVSASLVGGDGKDTLTVNTSGAGTTNVDGGLGNDSVNVTGRSTGKLTVALGEGDDSFTGTVVINATDSIDGGAGSDSLALKLVGAANIGAFANFEKFDAAGLGTNLDIGILASKNTVTEITASAALAAPVTLSNLGAGVGFRATGDMDGTALTLTQAAAGALTISQDVDETSTTAVATVAADRDANIIASNATSIKIDLDNDFVGAANPAATDNANDLNVTGTKATTLEIVSGGDNAINSVDYTGGDDTTVGKGDLLATVTISGAQAINFEYVPVTTSEITSVNASTLTGALTFNTVALKAESAANAFDGGKVTLGSGDDVITLVQGAVVGNIEKGSAEDLTAQANFDVFDFAIAADQAADAASNGATNILNGKLSFEGAGPATLADAIALADGRVAAAGGAVVFEYVGDSYIFVQNGATDIVVKLDDVTGLGGLDQLGATGDLYLI